MVSDKKTSYFVSENSAYANKYSEDDIVKTLDFLIENIFVEFGGRFFNRPLAFQWAQIDDFLSNNPTFSEHLDQIYQSELEDHCVIPIYSAVVF